MRNGYNFRRAIIFTTIFILFCFILSGCNSKTDDSITSYIYETESTKYELIINEDNSIELFVTENDNIVKYCGNCTLMSTNQYLVEINDSSKTIPSNLQKFIAVVDGEKFVIEAYKNGTIESLPGNIDITGKNPKPPIQFENEDYIKIDKNTKSDEEKNNEKPNIPSTKPEPSTSTEEGTEAKEEPQQGTEITEESQDTEPTDDPSNICEHTKIVVINYKAATCTVDGFTGDCYCADCEELIEKGKKILAQGHSYSSHYCTKCGIFSLHGTYKSKEKKDIITKEFGEIVNTEYSQVKITLTGLSIKHIKKKVFTDAFEYSFDGENCNINYIDTTIPDIDSPEAYGFVKRENYYELINKTEENGWEKTDKTILKLYKENTGVRTREIEEIQYLECESYTANANIITAKLVGGDEIEIALNFADDTFAEKDNSFCIKYYVNGAYYGNSLYADYHDVVDYYDGVKTLDIIEWYIDEQLSELFDVENFDIESHKENSSELSLYGQKLYKNTFCFNETEYTYEFDEYEGISRFIDVQNAILNKQNIVLKTNNYASVWKENGNIVTEFVVPSSASTLLANHKYTLTLIPTDGYSEVSLVTSDSGITEIYYVSNNELTKKTYLCEVIDECLDIPDADKLNYCYSYIDTVAVDYKDSRCDEAETSRYFNNNKLTVYRAFCGVQAIYYNTTETVETIMAGEKYTVKAQNGVNCWYFQGNDGIETINAGDELTVDGNIKLYAAYFAVTSYVGNKFVEETFLLSASDMLAFATEDMAEFEFIGWLSGEKTVLSEKTYDKSTATFLSDNGIDFVGKIEIVCSYKKETNTAPTVNVDGKNTIESYIGKNYKIIEKNIPKLSVDNGYSCENISEATLFSDGIVEYRHSLYGAYSVTVPRLTEYTFIDNNGVKNKIVINNGRFTLNIGLDSYEGIADFESKPNSLVMKIDGGTEIQYCYAVSINDDGACKIVPITALADLENVTLNQSTKADGEYGEYYRYVEEDSVMIAVEDGNYYALINNIDRYDNIEPYSENVYVAIKKKNTIYFSFIKISKTQHIVWYQINGSPENMPASTMNLEKAADGNVVSAYKFDGQKLILNNGNYTLGAETGTYYYDEGKKLYVLQKVGERAFDGFVYSVEGETKNITKYKMTNGEITAVE